jgi:hypothetical protein
MSNSLCQAMQERNFCWSTDIINSMKRGLSSEMNTPSPVHEISYILCNRKAHYLVHKSQLLGYKLSQINPLHIDKFYVFKVHFNSVLASAFL